MVLRERKAINYMKLNKKVSSDSTVIDCICNGS